MDKFQNHVVSGKDWINKSFEKKREKERESGKRLKGNEGSLSKWREQRGIGKIGTRRVDWKKNQMVKIDGNFWKLKQK